MNTLYHGPPAFASVQSARSVLQEVRPVDADERVHPVVTGKLLDDDVIGDLAEVHDEGRGVCREHDLDRAVRVEPREKFDELLGLHDCLLPL